jgi:hypothetical protein
VPRKGNAADLSSILDTEGSAFSILAGCDLADLCSEVRKILERMGRFFIRRMRIGFLHVPVKIFVRKMVEFETEVEKLNRAVVAVQKMMNKLNGVTSCALFE